MSNDKKPIYKKWWFWIVIILLFIVIMPSEQKNNDSTSDTSNQGTVNEIFNGENILSSTIDEVREELGEPLDGEYTEPTNIQISNGAIEWNNQYEKNGYTLIVDWNVSTREVTGLFITESSLSEAVEDWEYLLKVVDISPTNKKYNIIPVESAKNPEKYTGVNILE